MLSCFNTNAQQQDSLQIAVLARATQDSIMLRWSPTRYLDWQRGNRIGYHITRITISRNGESLQEPEELRLTSLPIAPEPLMNWETLAKQNENAAVLAQAIYGATFNTVTPGTDTGTIMTINDENEQRFTFALLAAEQSFRAAKMGGLGFVDMDVNENETYVYKIKMVRDPSALVEPLEGAVLSGFPYQERLPVPFGAVMTPGDQEIVLEWNYSMLKRFYSSYVIERSENGHDFQRTKERPIFNAQTVGQDQNVTLIYKDSVPNNKEFQYRILGQTAFDETGPPTKILSGTAKPNPKYAPIIEQSLFEGEDAVRLIWSFDNEEEKTIRGFQLRRADNHNGDFEDVGELLSPQTRETTYAPLEITNYFKVVAIGENIIERPSFATLVQPVDSIPPKPPVELKGVIDTTGVVRISWNQNTEPDLLGYRVYKSNHAETEFTQITPVEVKENSFVDTLNLKTLNKNIYYKVLAEDRRFNASGLSDLLALKLPNLTPPSPPLLTKYKLSEIGIELRWVPSSSDDLKSHTVFRKKSNEQGAVWEKIFESKNLSDTLYLDTEELLPDTYSYTVIAKDAMGLESDPANPVTITWHGKTIKNEDINFSGSSNRELRFINLNWRVKNYEILEYKLYRGTSKEELRLYKTLEGKAKGYNDVSLTINTLYVYGLQAILASGQISPLKLIDVKY